MAKNCTLKNGTCGFGDCVGGDKPGMCGINFGGPGQCSNSGAPNNGRCWFDKDCAEKNATCNSKNEHQHINQTCSTLLTKFAKDVTCDQGYQSAVSNSSNYQGSISPDKSTRQPCGFVCNKSPTPTPPLHPSSYICSPGLGCHADSRSPGKGSDGVRYSNLQPKFKKD